MKKKKIIYAIIPVLGLVLLGAGAVSAQGFFGSLSSDEIASRFNDSFGQKAQILGISVDELKNYWSQGKTVQEIASEKGITREQLQSKMKELRLNETKTRLQILVDKGIISQDQANARISFAQNNQNNLRGKDGHGFGMRGGSGMEF